jgi:hypothetical protein
MQGIAGLFAVQSFDSAAQPIGFIGEPTRARDAFHCGVTFERIEADAPFQLAQTDRAKMQWATIAFG